MVEIKFLSAILFMALPLHNEGVGHFPCLRRF
ncbi:hypothetical protein AFE_1599 [Acidithiobacillus ferrooxidans ATCC 23270]|uniref:Uncharacterized protein n=1 Tax=Acidithiobacillus ferrooxidans (strain ATCC 23270 / DSM 14882 / CIP 104768 / NCIMB 8455) TaxID=243159 RepID=B7JAU1_ACIF2|nr:hypothetical protein AFE_1599 [Acidithiobacillus ferrooxidans ATCC 23270]